MLVGFHSQPFRHHQLEFLRFSVGDQGQNDFHDQDLELNDTTTMLSMLNCLLLEVHNLAILKIRLLNSGFCDGHYEA